LVPDPLTALVCADVWVNEDGTIERRTRQARRLIRVLGLDDREYTEFRLMWMEIVDLAAGDTVTIATTSLAHMNRFPGIDAQAWDQIRLASSAAAPPSGPLSREGARKPCDVPCARNDQSDTSPFFSRSRTCSIRT
jgi:hypothetical protein